MNTIALAKSVLNKANPGCRIAIVMFIEPSDGKISLMSGSYGKTTEECKAGAVMLNQAHNAVLNYVNNVLGTTGRELPTPTGGD